MCYNDKKYGRYASMTEKEFLHDGHRKRLREKFNKGKESFQEHELLELLLSYSVPRKDTNPIAHRLINEFGGLPQVLSANPDLLTKVEGVGEISATLISLVNYITSVTNNAKNETIVLNNIDAVKKFAINLFKGLDHEIFYAFYLDGKNKVLGFTKIDEGKKDSVNIDFDALSKGIFAYKPKSAVILHNHFAKFPYPSDADDKATANVYAFLKFHKVTLFDHVIVSNDEVYSYFYDNRLENIKQYLKDKIL